MKKILMLGAVMLAVGVTSASAKTSKFGFYSSSGYPYCDGVKFSGSAPAVGYHVYDGTYCTYPSADGGGFSGKVSALGGGDWIQFAVSSGSSNYGGGEFVYTYELNPKSLLWVLFFESTDYGYPFEEINYGILVKGNPYAMHSPHQFKESTIHRAMSLLHKK